MDLKKMGGESVDCIHLVHDNMEQWQDFMSTVMNLKVSKKELYFVNNWAIGSVSIKAVLHGVG
jgi:hypothetical protein